MTEPFKYAASLSWGGDEPTAELEVEVEFSVAWGSPESGQMGPPEDYDPGSADLVENIRVIEIDGSAGPFDPDTVKAIIDKLELDRDDAMLDAAREEMARRAER